MKEYIDLAEAKSKAVYMHGFGRAKFVSVANLEKCKAADVVERDDLARVQVAHDKVGQALNVAGAFYAQGYHDAMTDHNLVERKRGEWVMTIYTTTSKRGRVISNAKYLCPQCGYGNGRKKTNFCPNCGADMRGENNG